MQESLRRIFNFPRKPPIISALFLLTVTCLLLYWFLPKADGPCYGTSFVGYRSNPHTLKLYDIDGSSWLVQQSLSRRFGLVRFASIQGAKSVGYLECAECNPPSKE